MKTRVLAVASGGGHWVQLLRMRQAWDGCDTTYVTVDPAYREDVAGARFRTINDATRWNKLRLLIMCLRLLWITVRVRPSVVVSTGAAPGYFALRFGKLIGARTVWVDSIANVESLSLTGRLVRPYADLWLTQWQDLAIEEGPRFAGAVL